jgi:hypothetical protein
MLNLILEFFCITLNCVQTINIGYIIVIKLWNNFILVLIELVFRPNGGGGGAPANGKVFKN